ncbi:hypothetical protein CASFOL_017282 [Castilleja foliolosa]|uniref:Uncharacterized protein n=1 Tax=Castilleja foliolosa TaxID=1961234 RepID=A0ABD3DAL9_9LAMI
MMVVGAGGASWWSRLRDQVAALVDGKADSSGPTGGFGLI